MKRVAHERRHLRKEPNQLPLDVRPGGASGFGGDYVEPQVIRREKSSSSNKVSKVDQTEAIPEECQDLSNVAPDASTLPPAFGWRNGEAWARPFTQQPADVPDVYDPTRVATKARRTAALLQAFHQRPGASASAFSTPGGRGLPVDL
eukprot:g31907.t1